jgi:hypothetical protein
VFRSLSTANAELEEEPDALAEELVVLDERLPDVPPAAPPEPAAAVVDELAVVEALVVPEPDTPSPTSPVRETIVPLSGA